MNISQLTTIDAIEVFIDGAQANQAAGQLNSAKGQFFSNFMSDSSRWPNKGFQSLSFRFIFELENKPFTNTLPSSQHLL